MKHYELICFINDLNAFRYGGVELACMNEQARQELSVVDMADIVLVPNRGTEEMLKKIGMTAKFVPVGVWDYLMTKEQSQALENCREQAAVNRSAVTRIAFAGNLNKSGFLTLMDIPEGISLELWGKLDEQKQKELFAAHGDQYHYHGVLSSDEIPQAICTMDYGLVWDGEGKDEIVGGLGEYLRYNNSHKCALYLASGIPVIVWSQSGMAHFVREYGCGVTIDRLSELEKKLATADYHRLKEKVDGVSKQLQQGYYLKRAIETALEETQN